MGSLLKAALIGARGVAGKIVGVASPDFVTQKTRIL